MSEWWWVPVALASAITLGIGLLWPFWRQRLHEARWAEARRRFFQRREWLEAEFLTTASRTGKPRGLMWADCDFDNPVSFARDRQSKRLCALVAVTIRFEALEGGGMEDVEAVGNLRAATAVFQYDGQRWFSDGNAQFNLNPAEVIERYRHELETVD